MQDDGPRWGCCHSYREGCMPSDVPRPGALRAAGSEAAGRARSAGRLGGRPGAGLVAGQRAGAPGAGSVRPMAPGGEAGPEAATREMDGWVVRAPPLCTCPPPAPRAPASSSPRAPPLQRRVVTTRCSLATRGSGGPVVCWAGPARGLRGAGRMRLRRASGSLPRSPFGS